MGRRLVAQCTVWTLLVIVVTPGSYQITGDGQITEPVLIQTAITNLAVETFDKGVLCWFARPNKMQPGTGFLTSEEHGF